VHAFLWRLVIASYELAPDSANHKGVIGELRVRHKGELRSSVKKFVLLRKDDPQPFLARVITAVRSHPNEKIWSLKERQPHELYKHKTPHCPRCAHRVAQLMRGAKRLVAFAP